MAKTINPMIPAAYIALRSLDDPQPHAQPWAVALKHQRTEQLSAMLAEFRPTLEAAFGAINGKASTFTLSASDAIALAVDTECRLAALAVPKVDRNKAEVMQRSAGPAASAYKNSAIGTAFTLRRDTKGNWLLAAVVRTEVFPKSPGSVRLTVSAAARDAIVKRALLGISTHMEPTNAPR